MARRVLARQVVEKIGAWERGNRIEMNRAIRILTAMEQVESEPTNSIFRKDETEGHWAVDVGGQYRLFFKFIPEHNVVFYCWVNDSDSLHDNSRKGRSDECYEVFKSLLNKGEIENYVHREIVDDKWTIDGDFGKDSYVYYELESGETISLTSSTEISDSTDRKTYFINDFSGNKRAEVLSRVVTDAKKSEIRLNAYARNQEERIILESFGFIETEQDYYVL